MTASLHKLTAGSGYDYLTRQVAAQDTTEKGHTSLASYHSEKGEAPGTWWGSGLAGLEDVGVGDQVSAEQMKALFGAGLHPNMASRLAALPVDASPEEIRDASRLGTPFPVFSGATAFQKEVAIRCSDWESGHPGVEVPMGVRAEIRNDIAREHFVARFGRSPSPLELSSAVAKLSRDPGTACALVIVDEAGMADTISLATVIDHVVGRGGSVRLVGDDQQLAAINAGGVLRDIAEVHGAVELNELLRFQDPAEANASLALRDGRPEALGFYLDEDRIHAGTQESSAEAAFNDWAWDRAAGLDSLMLASTRDTVTDLNRRARARRLTTAAGAGQGVEVGLVDANWASAGDVIITRLKDHHLAISATDWVKNGDRWIVQQVTNGGVVKARHCDSGLAVTLPQDYVAKYVQLGYAVTVHAAQGLMVDVSRGVLTGTESRQQLYVMATRGREANHLYVPIVGDGDEHSVVHPTTLRPETALAVLQAVLARDGAARSATTETRAQVSAPILLTHAATRYADALHLAAETTIDPDTVTALDQQADQVVDGLTSCAAWPALRATLLLNAVDGRDPLLQLRTAVVQHELESASDAAAVLAWRIRVPQGFAPLPWLRPIPENLAGHPRWGPYLSARATLVESCAEAVRGEVDQLDTPQWLPPGQQLDRELIEDVELWRAGTGVEASDRRVLGPVQIDAAARTWQESLENKLQVRTPSGWMDMLVHIHPEIHNDPYAAVLCHRISTLHETGAPVSKIVAAVVADGPFPAEQPAAALWWRLSRHLNPADQAAPLNPALNQPLVGGMPAKDPAGAHDVRPVDAAPEIAAYVAEDHRDEQRRKPEATTTWNSAMAADDSAQDQALHSPALKKSTEARWRDWGN